MKKYTIINSYLISAVFMLFTVLCLIMSCKKLVEVNSPATSLDGESVFTDDATAIAVITGVYAKMSNADVGTTEGLLTNVCFTTGLTGDELTLFNPNNSTFSQYLNNNIPTTGNIWKGVYNIIFIANSAIEGLTKSSTLTPGVKRQLVGEAKFIRAFCYFYLVNLYGDVPLAVSTDYVINRVLPRAPISKVYEQIMEDLIEAKELLNSEYVESDLLTVKSSTHRVRPTKWGAKALLARVYLYLERYSEAEAQATELINEKGLYGLENLNSAFLMNNKEAIWQLQPVGASSANTANTKEGLLLKLTSTGPDDGFYPVYLRTELVNSFETYDLRKAIWIDSVVVSDKKYYYPNKYKIGRENKATSEYSTVFRLAEQYLIRAEARIQQGNIGTGMDDLNILRLRATNLSSATDKQLKQLNRTLNKAEALIALENERKHELFTEWGHRWFDLKRWQGYSDLSKTRADEVLEVLKGENWQLTDKLFPIPQVDINLNPNLIGHQNPGYK